MKEKIVRKIKKPLSLLMGVLLMVMSVPEIPSAVENTESSQKYTVNLPIYDGCTYDYDESHLKKSTGSNTILEYEKEEEVSVKIHTENHMRVDKIHVCGEEKEEISVLWDGESQLRFHMPEQNVTLEPEIVYNEETLQIQSETELAVSETQLQPETGQTEPESQTRLETGQAESETQPVPETVQAELETQTQSEISQVESETQLGLGTDWVEPDTQSWSEIGQTEIETELLSEIGRTEPTSEAFPETDQEELETGYRSESEIQTETDPLEVEIQEISEQEEPETEHFLESASGTERLNREDFGSMRLVVLLSAEEEVADPEHVIAQYDSIYLLQYGSVEQSMNAYIYYQSHSNAVEPDRVVNTAAGSSGSEASGVTVTENANPIMALAEEPDSKIAQRTDGVIALIDTGAGESANVISRISLIDDALTGSNSHADSMVAAIAGQDANARILSIRAMGDDGHGTVSSVVAAMEYAMEQNVRIINLSLYAKTNLLNSVLESEILKASSMGIHVVGAAGNDGSDVLGYMPGCVEAAWIIGACDENGARLRNSNFGATVDYNVVAESTSEAAAKFSGYLSVHGVKEIQTGNGLIYAASSDEAADEEKNKFLDIIEPFEMKIAGYTWSDVSRIETDVEYYAGDTKRYTYVPDSWTDSEAKSSHKVVRFYDKNDKLILEKSAICLDPPKTGNGTSSSHTVMRLDNKTDYLNKTLSKILFYLYSGPAWGKTVYGTNGTDTYNFKQMLTEFGCDSSTLSNYYCCTHFILAWIYYGGTATETAASGWNTNVNAQGVKYIKNIIKALDACPVPSEAKLTKSAVTAKYDENGKRTTASVTYDANKDNKAEMTLPDGIVFVNDESGKKHTGTFSINGGTSFHFEIEESISKEGNETVSFTTTYPANFRAFRTTDGSSNEQDLGFSFFSESNDLSLKVSWPERRFLPVMIMKSSSNTDVTDGNIMYTLKGAEFELRGADGVAVASFVCDENGNTTAANLESAGSYTLVETVTPKGYRTAAPVLMTVSDADFGKYDSDHPLVIEVHDDPVTSVVDKFLEKKTDYATSASLAGAEFEVKFYGSETAVGTPLRSWKLQTILKDGKYVLEFSSECYVSGDTFYTDEKGNTVLPLGCVTFRETKAPAGFQINPEVFTNRIEENGSSGDGQMIYHVKTVKDVPVFGGVIVDKTSADFGQDTDGDAVFKGAVFSVTSLNEGTVCKSSEQNISYRKGEEIATITSGEDGIARIDAVLQAGEYRITEIKAPEGYRLSSQTIDFKISKHGEIVDKTDSPIVDEVKKGGFTIRKLDADTGKNIPQGDAVLSGAQFTVINRSVKSVRVEDRVYKPGETVMTIRTDENGYGGTGRNILPYGTYEVKETVPPKGYETDPAVKTVVIREDGQYDTLSYEYRDPVIRGGIRVNKYDIEVNSASGKQGDASLSGAEFTVINESEYPVVVDGNEYMKGEVVATLITDEDGTAATSAFAFPYGTYTVKETKAPYGYLLPDAGIAKTVQIRENGIIMTENIKEEVVRGGVKIAKWDRELDCERAAQGAATLAGAEFTLTNKSAGSVYVDADGDGVREVYASGQIITVFVTDENGEVKTTADFLPCGTYHVKETKVPKGYTWKGENLEWDFSVGGSKTDYGKIYDYATADTAVKNVPVHFDIDLIKFKDTLISEDATDRMIPLAGIRFTIKNMNEQEVVVRGKTYHPKEVVMTITTDENGFASTNEKDAGNCESGALPYGKYEISEVNCPEGLTPVKNFIVNGTEEGGVYDGKTYKGIYLNDIPVESRIRIRKTDAQTGKTIPQGATFQILDEKKQVIDFLVTYPTAYHRTEFTTNADGIIETPTKLPYGTYYLHEVDPPYDREAFSNGYVVGKDLLFMVNENNAWEDVIEVTYTDIPAKGDITVTKTDGRTDEKIEGAVFAVFADEDIVTGDGTVRYKKGEQIDVFTVNEEGEGSSRPLYLGRYHLQEIKAPKGYCLDTTPYPFVLTYEEAHKEYEVKHENLKDSIANNPTVLNLQKKDVDGTALDGVIFEVERIGGEADSGIASEKAVSGGKYITKNGGYISIPYLISGIYSVREVKTLPGYVPDPTQRYVTVDANGFIYESDKNGNHQNETNAKSDMLLLTWINDYTKWDFSKVDVTGTHEIPGAELEIYDSENDLVCSWISAEEPHRVNKLPAGEYTLVEKCAPEGYVAASTVSFTVTETGEVQKAVMTDQQTMIRKVDISGRSVSGAKLAVYEIMEANRSDSFVTEMEPVDSWESGEEPHAVSGLSVGRTYKLIEQETPKGYVQAEPIVFTVEEHGKNQEISLENEPTKVIISKQDITTEEELPGALLEIIDKDGNVTESWISETEPHYVEMLPVGIYTLRETTAPAGYVTSEHVVFEVKDTAEIQKVVMKDDITRVEITKTDLTDGKPVIGAELVIKNKEGVEIEKWVTDEKPHYIEKLPVGEYTLTEITAPDGYEKAETVIFSVEDTGEIQHVEMFDSPESQESETQESESEPNGSEPQETEPVTRRPTGSGGGSTPVKTGDYNRYAPAVTAIILGICLAAILGFIKRKDRH